MQRAPTFVFSQRPGSTGFCLWLKENFLQIKAVAETTTSVGKLNEIEQYHAHNMVFTRFDYSTGDAAGQNMTSRATFTACEWIVKQYPQLSTTCCRAVFDTEKERPRSTCSRGEASG